LRIEIDIDDLIQEFSLPQNTADLMVSQAVNNVTTEMYRNWRLEAANQLTSSRNEYVNGLQIIDNSQFSKTIKLNGVLANMVEKGASAFDMKEGFRKSSKVKYSIKTDKNGAVTYSWYLTIPFRMGVPTTIGDNAAFSGIMPKPIYNIVKNKPSNTGLVSSEIPHPYEKLGKRSRILIPSKNIDIPEYKHKHSIFEGLTKQTAAYGKTTQNTYVSFRRVGEKSDQNSWMHKGIKAHNLLPAARAATDVDTVVNNTVDEILANLGYGI